jgi:hypothetical protein
MRDCLKPKPNITGKGFMTTITQASAKAPMTATRPEVELLLCFARTRIDAKTSERIRTLLQEDIDWAYLIQTAAQHGVMPLLYQSLNTTCPEVVPKAILNQLRNHFHCNVAHNLLLTSELLKLLNFFKDHNIPVIPFKGPVLAASAYGNLALRQFCDLDILVHERDFLKARDLLISQGGYQRRYLLFDTHDNPLVKSSNEYSLTRNDGRVCVDLHQSITARHFFSFPLDFDRLWQRLEPVSLTNTTVLNLQSEDLFLILCVHGSKHLWERLGWICDIAELTRSHQEIDWSGLIEQAKKLGCERMLWLGLSLASSLLGATLPQTVYQKIQADEECQSLTTQVRQRLFLKTDSLTQGFSWSQLGFHFRMMERLEDKIHFCIGSLWRWVFVPIRRPILYIIQPTFRDQEFLPLPRSFYFLYYFIRPIRLAFKLGLIAVQRLEKLKKTQAV